MAGYVVIEDIGGARKDMWLTLSALLGSAYRSAFVRTDANMSLPALV